MAAPLVAGPAWQADFRDALRRDWDLTHLGAAAFDAARNDNQAVAAFLGAGHKLVEGSGKRYAATLLAVAKGKPYGTYRDQDSGNLLIAVEQDTALRGLFEGINRNVRVSAAHQEYRLDHDRVVLTNRGADVEARVGR